MATSDDLAAPFGEAAEAWSEHYLGLLKSASSGELANLLSQIADDTDQGSNIAVTLRAASARLLGLSGRDSVPSDPCVAFLIGWINTSTKKCERVTISPEDARSLVHNGARFPLNITYISGSTFDTAALALKVLVKKSGMLDWAMEMLDV